MSGLHSKKWVYQDIDSIIEGPTEGGKGNTNWGFLRTHVKCSSPNPDECYELFNEAVAVELARLCGLPVLDQFFYLQDNNLYSVTPRIGNHKIPPPSENELLKILSANPELSHGMVLFDLWVANNDRRPANIQYGQEAGSVYLIDFGNALLYRAQHKGLKRLDDLEQYPENQYTEQGKKYGYTKLLTDPTCVDYWHKRFLSIPKWMIENVVSRGNELIQMGLSIVEPSPGVIKESVYRFLIKRRNLLKTLVEYLAKEGIFTEYKTAQEPKKDADNHKEKKGEGDLVD